MKRLISLICIAAMLSAFALSPGLGISVGATGAPKIDLTTGMVTVSNDANLWGFSKDSLVDGFRVFGQGGRFAAISTANLTGGVPGDSVVIDEWIQVDLGNKHTIDKYGFAAMGNDSGGRPVNFTISVSVNGTDDWTPVVTEADMPLADSTNWYEFPFAAAEARFVKLHVTKIDKATDIGYYLELNEIEIYGEESGTPVLPLPKIDLSSYLDGRSDNSDMPGWDPNGDIIKASHSMEIGWAPGYSKGFLIDNVAGNGSWPVTVGQFRAVNLSGNDPIDINTTTNIDEWIEINLQSKYTVDQFGFAALYSVLTSGIPADFTIDVSLDGDNWTTVVTKTDYSQTSLWHHFSFDAVEAQYIRLNASKVTSMVGDSSEAGYTIAFTEIEIYGEPFVEPPAPPLPKIDLSSYLGGRSNNTDMPGWDPNGDIIKTSHSTEVGWSNGYSKGFLIDNVVGSGAWPINVGQFVAINNSGDNLVNPNTTSSINEWIQVDLKSKHTVDQFGFAALYSVLTAGVPTDFTIDVSLDGNNWTTVVTKSNYATLSLWHRFSFDAVEARYIRLNATKATSAVGDSGEFGYTIAFTEIEIYGEPVEVPPSLTEKKPFGLGVVYSQIFDRITINDIASLAQQLGVESVRAWHLSYTMMDSYNMINKSKAQKYHDLYKAYKAVGIDQIVATNGYFYYPNSLGTGGQGNEQNCNVWIPARDTTPNSNYMKFLDMYRITWRTLAAEFTEVTHWEMGNEYNHDPFMHPYGWTEDGKGTPAFTLNQKADISTDLMYYATLGIKEGNPAAITVMPGMAPADGLMANGTPAITDYLDRIYNNIASGNFGGGSQNIDDYFECVAWHPYSPGNVINQNWVNQNNIVYAVMTAHNDGDRPVFFTEMGLQDGGSSQTDTNQAASVASMYQYIAQQMPYVYSTHYYRMFDDDATGGNDTFGLFKDPINGSIIPKAKGLAYQQAAGGSGSLVPQDLHLDEIPKIDLSAQLGGRYSSALAGWDAESNVVLASSSVEEGWGAAKGSLIDGKTGNGFTGPDSENPTNSIFMYSSAAHPTASVNEWVGLNLQEGYKVSKVSFSTFAAGSGQGMPKNFTIETSPDSLVWTPVLTKTNFAPQTGDLTYTFDFEPTAAKFIRVNVSEINEDVAGAGSYYLALTELTAYGTGSKMDLSGHLGLGRKMGWHPDRMSGWDEDGYIIDVSDSFEGMDMGGTGRGYLIDGDTAPAVWNSYGFMSNGFYLSSFTDYVNPANVDIYVDVNLQDIHRINAFGFWTLYQNSSVAGAPKNFTISVSTNGVNYTTVVTKTNYSASGHDVFEFDSVEAQYIRLNVTAIGGTVAGLGTERYALALTELEIYEDLIYVDYPDSIDLVALSGYTIDNGLLLGVAPNTNLAEFKSKFVPSPYLKFEEIVGTGAKVSLLNDENISLTIVIEGDLSGDGNISASDLVVLKKYILELIPLSKAQNAAGCMVSQSVPQISDLVAIKKLIV